MLTQQVTLEMLYELLKDFKADTNRRFEQASDELKEFKADNNRRFEQVDKRFEQIDKRFEQIDSELKQIREMIREDKNKLEKVYESRNRVTVNFTRSWMLASFGIAIFVSLFTAMIVIIVR